MKIYLIRYQFYFSVPKMDQLSSRKKRSRDSTDSKASASSKCPQLDIHTESTLQLHNWSSNLPNNEILPVEEVVHTKPKKSKKKKKEKYDESKRERKRKKKKSREENGSSKSYVENMDENEFKMRINLKGSTSNPSTSSVNRMAAPPSETDSETAQEIPPRPARARRTLSRTPTYNDDADHELDEEQEDEQEEQEEQAVPVGLKWLPPDTWKLTGKGEKRYYSIKNKKYLSKAPRKILKKHHEVRYCHETMESLHKDNEKRIIQVSVMTII